MKEHAESVERPGVRPQARQMCDLQLLSPERIGFGK